MSGQGAAGVGVSAAPHQRPPRDPVEGTKRAGSGTPRALSALRRGGAGGGRPPRHRRRC
jgi:hypothetical protein